ncbi:protein SENSITIVITY TO RED LIGHT REDUCED 1-like isoform X2 [Solanum dulcamara]|uniref:protein SENSITIVITY TO RED LIGHT REDUCED 1-like isoform X2 n=1 Tax=Solanum dulcamara TaxID=45834 RepID=UPI0024863BD6|nr:protein SENSITIVITY TO RED LIGHT REDUCED 1-like isoform X2 [Solanum dulcamara]
MNFGEDMESNVDFHIKDEAERLLKEIELLKKNVENSELYSEMRLDLKQNKTLQKHFFRILGSHSHVQVVIYGLGSIEYNFSSQFQLAVALLLKRDFSNCIGNIEIYDPCMSPADIIVFEKLGLKVLTIDENCKKRVQRPTMFYMPNPYCYLVGNLLGANWSSSCLSQISLLTNSFCETLSQMQRTSHNLETALRLERILDVTTEIAIKTSKNQIYASLFSTEIAWHFFDVDPNIDIDIDKPGCYWLDMQRHLEEEFLVDMEKDIMTSWIKLNIYGIGTKGDQPGRYSGIFKDEKGKCFDRYRGNIDVEDNVIAGLEALKIGLAGCVEGMPIAQKLIVESDDVILVHYVNGLPEPNDTAMHMVSEIFDLLKRLTCAVYHIYEEANEAARDLALRGECSNSA